MAGVKGRSGGKREGAGRKPGPAEPPDKAPEAVDTRDPLEFLLDVMQGIVDPSPAQVRAAIAAAQYKHTKRGDGGKKEEKQEAAEKAAGGKFGVRQPPRLVAGG